MIAEAAQERLAPKTVAQLCEILARCDRERRNVRVEGGKTLSGFGPVLAQADFIVSTTNLHAIITHEYHDLTCSVQSGVRVAQLAAALAKHGQFVPIDVPLSKKATVGGSLASGWPGPRRHLYGRARDFVIGSQVVLADGTLAHAGGMVVKNVSGYDMSKLYIGSFGTLGVFAQLNFKTLPIPRRRRALIAPLPEATRSRAIMQIAALPVIPAAAFCAEGFGKTVDGTDDIDGRVLLYFEGSEELLDRATLEARSALGRAGVPETAIVDTGASESFDRSLNACIANKRGRSITYRSLGLPGTAQERAVLLRDVCNRHELFTDVLFDVMNGDVFVRASERSAERFAAKIALCHAELRALEPRAVIVASDAPIRATFEAWGATPPAIEKMRALKARFDPHGTLNPGRFIGGI
ncbi:MAG TPA: FAD-binding oxidoreductase [Candidatus Rubrimentiphilum sp.]|nr:FAD-binding oxidoreductase [Candidatus Rubrimentiphilum sp.]